MARLVIYKAPAQGSLNEEFALAWEELADQLRDLGHDVRREDRYMEPGRRGITFGEVVAVYIGMKALDTVTGHVMDAALQRIIDAAKAWGRERFGKRGDAPNPRPVVITFFDEEGKVIRTWKIDKDGEQEQTPPDDQQQAWRPPVDLESGPVGDKAPAKDAAAKGEEPESGCSLASPTKTPISGWMPSWVTSTAPWRT